MALSRQDAERDTDLGVAQADGDTTANMSAIVTGIRDAVRDGAYAVDPDLLDALEAYSCFSSTAGGRLMQPVGLADIKETHLPSAQEELDAVVQETETAANSIMCAVEEIERLAGTLDGEMLDQMTEQVMNIYQACSFQDITGQRIVNVGKTLKDIEFVADSTLGSLGDEEALVRIDESLAVRGEQSPGGEDEAGLLNGPQLEGGGNSQDDIDNILASFD